MRFTDIEMDDVLTPVAINMYYHCGLREDESGLLSPEVRAVDETTPEIVGVEIGRIKARGVRASAGYICGLPERPVRNLHIHDMEVELAARTTVPPGEAAMAQGPPEPPDRGVYICWSDSPELENVTVRTAGGE